MNIQYDAKRPLKLFEEDLEFYAHQLYALVKLYREHIYIKSDKQLNALNELEYYANQMVNKNYDALITNAHEIITKDQSEVPF